MTPPTRPPLEIKSTTAVVTSIARNLTPPDTTGVTVALQTTLNLEQMLQIFSDEVLPVVPHEGLAFRNESLGIAVAIGLQGRHRVSYQLTLCLENLGELTLMAKRPFSELDLMRTEHLLTALMYPLRNALRFRELERTAYKDPLTSVGNRAAMEDALHREVELARRQGSQLSLIAVDLDHFKRVNDAHGHSVGDVVLQAAAARMHEAIRASDLLFRYGGEEFVVVLAQTGLSGAELVAERIRSRIAESAIIGEGFSLSVAVSLGVAMYSPPDSARDLFNKADRALYAAKRGGRNRVACWK